MDINYIAIDPGHLRSGVDTSAIGIRSEYELIREVCQVLFKKLDDANIRYINVEPESATSVRDSLRQRTSRANAAKVDLFLSIHFNAFNGNAHGTEAFVFQIGNNPELDTTARNMLNLISQAGHVNRGLKSQRFQVLRETTMPAILLECCFCDSRRDMNIYKPEIYADAIFQSLFDGKASDKVESQPANSGEVVRIVREIEVPVSTWLKPDTRQSRDIRLELLTPIPPGVYTVEIVSTEENHYSVEFLRGSLAGKKGFIFSDHVKLRYA